MPYLVLYGGNLAMAAQSRQKMICRVESAHPAVLNTLGCYATSVLCEMCDTELILCCRENTDCIIYSRRCWQPQLLGINNAGRRLGNFCKGTIHKWQHICLRPHRVPTEPCCHIARRQRRLSSNEIAHQHPTSCAIHSTHHARPSPQRRRRNMWHNHRVAALFQAGLHGRLILKHIQPTPKLWVGLVPGG